MEWKNSQGYEKVFGATWLYLILVHSTPEHRGHLTCLYHPTFPPTLGLLFQYTYNQFQDPGFGFSFS